MQRNAPPVRRQVRRGVTKVLPGFTVHRRLQAAAASEVGRNKKSRHHEFKPVPNPRIPAAHPKCRDHPDHAPVRTPARACAETVHCLMAMDDRAFHRTLYNPAP